MNTATMTTPHHPTLAEVHEARERIAPFIRRTPLIRLDLDLPDRQVFVKLETLQPIGAFKIRPALNAVLSRDMNALRAGIATISSGNMAYGIAWAARHAGVPMAAYMYGDAPKTKVDGVRRLGGEIRFVPHSTWWRYMVGLEQPDQPELLINPVIDQAVLAGNGTIGVEIVEDLPDVDCVLVPFGGGSLTSGLGSAVKAMRPQARILAVEAEHATPLSAALAAGHIVDVDMRPSFVKSIGGPAIVPLIWPLARSVVDGAVVVSLARIAEAIRLLFSSARIVAEGAGAAALAASLLDPRATGNVVCIISGGNIDINDYLEVLSGGIPLQAETAQGSGADETLQFAT